MKYKFKILAQILVSLLAFVPSFSNAMDYKIFATVNGEAITTEQVRDRVNLILASAGMPDTAESKKSVTVEVADILINELLQKQDAKEKNVAVSDAEEKEMLTALEKRNGLKPGGFKHFIEEKGLSYDTMMDQINAGLLWKKIISTYIRPGIVVTESDIKNAAENKPKHAGMKKVDVSEIIIPIEFNKEKETKDLAETIAATARVGTKTFEELAARYSAGKTAKQEGHLGWIPEEGVKEPLASNIKKTEVGKVTDPIKVGALYVILKVNDRASIEPEDKSTPQERAFMTKMEEGAKKYVKNLRDTGYIEKKYDDKNIYSFVWQ